MKKGITAWPDYDWCGRWCLIIEKARGMLTLEDIKRAARELEWEWDYYLLSNSCNRAMLYCTERVDKNND